MFPGFKTLSSRKILSAFCEEFIRDPFITHSRNHPGTDPRVRGNDKTTKLLCLLLLILTPISAIALQTDKKEKAYISADAGIYNFKTGINRFDGHVRIDQGTTHLTADRLITKSNNKHKIQEAVAYGFTDLAHYWTVPKLDDPEMHGRAKIIKYYPIASNITLEQEALVTQGENSFQGQLIHYSSTHQTIAVPAMAKNRAVLVYNPDK